MYVNTRHSRVTIGFHGFDQEIDIKYDASSQILEEHYAEAVQIADRSYAASNSRASNPGDLTVSIEKVEALELLTTGLSQLDTIFHVV